MLPFLPPAGSVVEYKNTLTGHSANYVITGYKDKTIAQLYDIDTGRNTCIIMQFPKWSFKDMYITSEFNPYITLMN